MQVATVGQHAVLSVGQRGMESFEYPWMCPCDSIYMHAWTIKDAYNQIQTLVLNRLSERATGLKYELNSLCTSENYSYYALHSL